MMEEESRNSLSNLPDDILHHILSFLDVKDIARLRVLSRRFQTLSITTPSFSFSEYPPYYSRCSCLHVFNFMNNTIPQKRPHDMKIDRLSLTSSCMKSKHHKLHMQWLNKLFEAFRVDELSLHYELIHCIFTSLSTFQSLKVLKLIISPRVPVKLPEMNLASLERLHIEWIETQDSIGMWISQSFPSLKSLTLSKVHMWLVSRKQLDLTIQSSCLEDLTIEFCCSFKPVRIITDNLRALSYTNCYGDEHCIHDRLNEDGVVVDVFAPNLQSLVWEGSPRRLCYDIKTFKNLHVATITGLSFHDLNLAKQLFEAIYWVGILRIDSDILQNLYGKPLNSFGNVRHLEIRVHPAFCDDSFDNDNVYDVLTTFLERVSNLETLTFAPVNSSEKAPHIPYSFKYALKKCRKSKWKKINGLKKVKFIIKNMQGPMAFLMGMLKKSCADMKEMTLIYPSLYHESLKLYLNCLESASSTLLINLSPPNRKRCGSQYSHDLHSLKTPSQLYYQDGDDQSSSAEGKLLRWRHKHRRLPRSFIKKVPLIPI